MSLFPRTTGARLWPTLALAALVCLAACGSPPLEPTPTVTIVCPANASARAPLDGTTATVTFAAPSAAGGKGALTTSCSPVSGASFPVGTTAVACTATDTAAHTAQCSFSVTVDPPPIPRLTLTRFLAYGDSLTEGKTSLDKCVGGMVFPTSYTLKLMTMLQTRYTAQTITVANQGCGGETAVAAVETGRFDEALAAENPQVLLLMEGANDINGTDPRVIPGVIVALDTMGSRAAARGAQVFIATLPPQNPAGRNGKGAPFVPQLNKGIADLAAPRGWTVVDVNAAFNGNLGLIGSDGLHPTDAGHQVIAQAFYDRIKAKLETVPSSFR